MARPRNTPPAEGALTVLIDDAIHDGKGGFLKAGDPVTPADDDARESLIAKGLAR